MFAFVAVLDLGLVEAARAYSRINAFRTGVAAGTTGLHAAEVGTMTALWVALGGAVGTLMRYGITVGMARVVGVAWPFGTFTANVLGSFALVFLMELAPERTVGGADIRLVLGTGLLGGFTTYSSFNLETLRMAQHAGWGRASAYVSATLLVCFAGGLLGYGLARWVRLQGEA